MSDFPLVDRRGFLKILGVTGAALTGCAPQKTEKLIPYLVPPENIVPGVASWFATVCRECPAGCGMIVRNREGRAVKVEGNPAHPVNRGRLCIRGQASLQGLYNPDRIRQPLERAPGGFQPLSWEQGEKRVVERLAELRLQDKADRIALVTPLVTGSLDALIDEWTAALGIRRRLRYEPFAYEPLRAANRLTFGRDAIPEYKIAAAEVLLSFGADFLETWLSNVDYAGSFKQMHTPRDGRLGRFLHVESRLSLTAANADQWMRVAPGSEGLLALGLLRVILEEGLQARELPPAEARRIHDWVKDFDPETVASRTGLAVEEIPRLARLFAAAEPGLALGSGVAASGGNATLTQVAVNLLNYVTGNVGRTVVFGPDSSLGHLDTFDDMRALVRAMNEGEVEALLLFDVNPAYSLPLRLGFADALSRVPFVANFSPFLDETTARADLILPSSTSLESWGDYEPRRGIHGLQQPVMEPVFDTRAVGDTLLSLARQLGDEVAGKFEGDDFHAYLRERWRALHRELAPEEDFDTFWKEALRRGGVFAPPRPEEVRLAPQAFSQKPAPPAFEGSGSGLALVVYPSLHYFDGRGANRPWLQEVPEPLTKVVWDNWVEMHPETARRLGVRRGDVVLLRSPHGRIELPALISEGIHPGAVAVSLGQGHTEYGRYARGRGANPIALLPAEPEAASGGLAWLSVKVEVAKIGRSEPLVAAEGSEHELAREIAQLIPLAEAMRAPSEVDEGHKFVPELYPDHEHKDYRWGMVIDTNACIGCNACVAACYAENNLPIVGKKQVAQRRESAWIRVERYFDGGAQPQSFVPMLCQHCDNAPCEPVCPVYATYHNPEGLNVQVYNRCVGTRYCANNCPYKVRRFNWFGAQWDEPLELQLNPDVTVRSKGVMEKCTFCVQRIQSAKDQAKDEGRLVRDGEFAPACVQTCPTEAFVFGDLEDPSSRVAKMACSGRRYHVLEHLNTRPAVTYLKKIVQEPRS